MRILCLVESFLAKETYLMAASLMGADHVLAKPFDVQGLIEIVEDTLG